jgi:hypothetical protein
MGIDDGKWGEIAGVEWQRRLARVRAIPSAMLRVKIHDPW